MLKTMMAGLTAFSLSFTPAPAAALTDEEVGQLLLGLLAIGVVGKIIENNKDRRARPVQEIPLAVHEPRKPRIVAPQLQRHETQSLPRDCLRIVETQRGPQRIFSAHCLNRNFRDAHLLPQQCAVRVRGYDGPRRGYDPSCLRDFGYRARRD